MLNNSRGSAWKKWWCLICIKKYMAWLKAIFGQKLISVLYSCSIQCTTEITQCTYGIKLKSAPFQTMLVSLAESHLCMWRDLMGVWRASSACKSMFSTCGEPYCIPDPFPTWGWGLTVYTTPYTCYLIITCSSPLGNPSFNMNCRISLISGSRILSYVLASGHSWVSSWPQLISNTRWPK